MRYYYEPEQLLNARYGEIYICNHPVYSRCTLYKVRKNGLAVIQQRFNSETKSTYWSEIDKALVDNIYLHPSFYGYFQSRSAEAVDNLYPTVTVRQIMWALKMKPLKRERWETVFDRREI